MKITTILLTATKTSFKGHSFFTAHLGGDLEKEGFTVIEGCLMNGLILADLDDFWIECCFGGHHIADDQEWIEEETLMQTVEKPVSRAEVVREALGALDLLIEEYLRADHLLAEEQIVNDWLKADEEA